MNIDLIEKTPSVALADHARTLKNSGLSIIELQTGDPDFSTHPDIITATHKALLAGETHYSFSSGLPLLRKCIASEMARDFDIALSSKNILITQGAVQGTLAVLSALVESGDEVIILEPNWPTVDSLVNVCGGRPIKVSHLVTDEKLFDSLDKCLSKKTKILCINSPNNPTGCVFSKYRIQCLVDWCHQHSLFLVSDEVYRSIIFDCVHSSVMHHYKDNENIVFIDSFSKKYAMTGWRVGIVVAHFKLIEKIAKASQIQITHVAPFVQLGALEALQNKEVCNFVNMMKLQYAKRRNFLIKLCEQLGLEIIVPQGAFYLFLNVGGDDVSYSKKLLNEHSICVIPGSSYGASGRGYIRLTFAAQKNVVADALKVISQTLVGKEH